MKNKNAAVRLSVVGHGVAEFGLSDAPGAREERRTDERIVTIFRLAKLAGSKEEFCLIRNISAAGLMADVFSPKAVGERLTVDLGDDLPRPACIIWVEGDRVGIAFDDMIDVAQVLAQVPVPGRARSRPLRLLVKLDAKLIAGKVPGKCQVIDISQGGSKFQTDTALTVGDDVTLEIAGLGRLVGTIRWVKDTAAGISFREQLSYRTLAGWIASQGSE